MSESNINVNPSSIICKTINIRLNKQITFTCRQIESLLKLQFSNMKPQECVTLVASKLKLHNIEENCIHAWLADRLSSVIRNIQLSRFSLQQGVVIVRWIVYYMSLVIVENLSKVMLFEKLRMGIIVALENAGDNMIPPPNSTECTTSSVSSTKNRAKYATNTDADDSKPTAIQIAAIIANTLHEIFWDDFKYTVVQMAFNTDPMQKIKNLNRIKDLDPLHLQNDSVDLQNENTADEDNECYDGRMFAIMDRYFFREPINPSLDFDRLIISLKQSMCRRRKLYVLDKDNNDGSVRSTKNVKNVKIQQ
ncbi:uncharacterized protein LOC132934265 [Metopolophium dirhodum]|uniref:uncharacterized protein LOC132934265 n=1 Tax=Metopolophium dirhodum TaxID=44670 RepID=UPI00298FF7CE|nr:uncharacterized protein LOC132934265 [Metopolophium dirhodum]